MKTNHYLLIVLSFFSSSIHAATIAIADLPGSIQSCMGTSCLVNMASTYDSGAVSAFQIMQSSGSEVYTQNWLIRYSLSAPSSESRINPTSSTPLSGNLWLLAKTVYTATETSHPFTLYLDKVTPTPFLMPGQGGSDLALSMTTSDLLSGGAFRTAGIDESNNVYDYGSLIGAPVLCVASGCETHAQLNLLQLHYKSLGTTLTLDYFNPLDERTLVFNQRSSFTGLGCLDCATNDVQSFYVSAVPLPSALSSLTLGLFVFTGVLARQRRFLNLNLRAA